LFEIEVVVMFGKKPRIKQGRIDGVLSQHKPPIAHPSPTAIKLSRSERLQAWAPCMLSWSPNGSAEGICIDHSSSGARIRFVHKLNIPDEFRFVSVRLGISCDAALVRQDGYDAAIKFLSGTASG
jgi:hypothetical protein